MDAVRHYARLLSLPLTLLAITATLRVAWSVLDFPEPQVLAELAGGWLSRYGLPVIFLAAMLEGMLLVGGYFPGIFIIFISVLVARSVPEVALFTAVGTAGLYVAHLANYALGRHGWYRLLVRFGLKSAVDQARGRVLRYGPLAVWSSYWLPSLSALTDTAAGITHMRFATFALHSLAAAIVWDTFAAAVMYCLGPRAFYLISPGGSNPWVVFGGLLLWCAALVAWDFRTRKVVAR